MVRTLGILLVLVAACAALNLLFAEFVEPYVVQVANLCGVAIILAVSLNVINGLTGQFSLGHAGFMAIGAYVSAYFTTNLSYFDPETAQYVTENALVTSTWGYVPALIVGALAAAFAGLLVGIPTLRLRGDYLAIATLGFGEIVRIMITNFKAVGGANGLSGVPQFRVSLWGVGADGVHLDATFFIFAFAAACILFSVNLQRSSFGRALIAIRENELAAEVMGIRAARLKIMAFVYGAFFAGLAGGLFAHLMQTITPSSFTFMKSVEVVVMLVLGGLGSLTGAVAGAIVLTVLPESLRDVESGVRSTFVGTYLLIYTACWLPLLLLLARLAPGVLSARARFWSCVGASVMLGVLTWVLLRQPALPGKQPLFIGAHLLVYALLLFPIARGATYLLRGGATSGTRTLLALVVAEAGSFAIAIGFWLAREDHSQPKLPGIRMVVYALILILLMIFRPQGIFGQRELSLKLLRRLIPGGRGK